MRLGFIFLGFLLVANLSFYAVGAGLLDEQAVTIVSGVLTIATAAFALYASMLVFASAGGENETIARVWLFISIGLFLWLLGEIAWVAQQVFFAIDVPYPSVADAFWILGYPFLLYGIMLRLASLVAVDTRLTQFQISAVIATALLASLLIFGAPGGFSFDVTKPQKFLNLLYALGDFVLFFLSISIAFAFAGESALFGNEKLIPVAIVFATGFALHSLYDVLYGGLVVVEGAYKAGIAIDALYNLAYWLIGLGAYMRAALVQEESVT